MSFSGLMAQSDKKSRLIKPTSFQKRVYTIVSGKTRYYYSLDSEKSSTISIKGPGVLRIITRGRFVPDEADKISYEIIYSINGGEKINYEISNSKRSKKATYQKGKLGVPGQLKDFEIELGRGYHSIDFMLDGNSPPVAARYLFYPSKTKKQDWISFSPVQPSEPISLVSRESSVSYYRFSKENPLKITINGPTDLRVLTRVEFDYQMKGRIKFRLKVMEKGEIINTYQLSSRRSDIAVYKDHNELTPGKACELLLSIPKGRHTYELIPLDKDKETLLGRFLIPEKDVKLVD